MSNYEFCELNSFRLKCKDIATRTLEFVAKTYFFFAISWKYNENQYILRLF